MDEKTEALKSIEMSLTLEEIVEKLLFLTEGFLK